MNGDSANEAWLDLQELYSSINFLKAKLNATGEKIRAASQEGPVQLDQQNIQRMSSPPFSRSRYISAETSTRMLHTGARSRPRQRCIKESDILQVSRVISQNNQKDQLTFVEPICINTHSRHPVSPLSINNDHSNGSLLGHGASIYHGRHLGRIGSASHEGRRTGHVNKKPSMRFMENIREITDKEKQTSSNDCMSTQAKEAVFHDLKAENVYGFITQDHASRSTSTSGGVRACDQNPSMSLYRHSLDQQNVIGFTGYAQPLVLPTNGISYHGTHTEDKSGAVCDGNLHVQPKSRSCNLADKQVEVCKDTTQDCPPTSHQDFGNGALLSPQDAGESNVPSATMFKSIAASKGRNGLEAEKESLAEPCADSNLDFAGRRWYGAQGFRRMWNEKSTSNCALNTLSQHENEEESSIGRSFPKDTYHVAQHQMKRKVTLMRKLKNIPEYPHKPHTKAGRKVCRIGKGAEAHIVPSKGRPDKGNVLSHHASVAAVIKQSDHVQAGGPVGRARNPHCGIGLEMPLRQSKSVKRKAQSHVANMGQSPAPKFRHYDASVMGEYVRRPPCAKFLRKKNDREAHLSSVAQVAAKEKFSRSQLAFQRKAAVASAVTGRKRNLSMQKDQGSLHAALDQSCKMSLESCSDDTDYSSDAGEIYPKKSGAQPVSSPSANAAAKRAFKSKQQNSGEDADHCNTSISSFSSPPTQRRQLSEGAGYVVSGHPQIPKAEDANVPTKEFLYQPTQQIKHIQETIAYIDSMVSEELTRIGCNSSCDKKSTGLKTGDVACRIREALVSFDFSILQDVGMHHKIESLEQCDRSEDAALKSNSTTHKEKLAARKIQHSFHNYGMQKREVLSEVPSKAFDMGQCVTEVVRQDAEKDNSCSREDSVAKSDGTDISFYNLVPESFTFAKAWKLKNFGGGAAGAFMTSTQSEGKLSPNFSISTLDGDAPRNASEKQLSEIDCRGDDCSVHDNAIIDMTLLAGETVESIRSDTEIGLADAAHVASQDQSTNEEVTSRAPDAVGRVSVTESVHEDKMYPGKVPMCPIEHVNRIDERVWRLLGTQAEAAKASAEATRHLAEVQSSSLLIQQSQELTTLLTASTVAAASALATCLSAQSALPRPVHVITAEQQTEPWQHQSSSAAIEFVSSTSLADGQTAHVAHPAVNGTNVSDDVPFQAQLSTHGSRGGQESGSTDCHNASPQDEDTSKTVSEDLELNDADLPIAMNWGRTDISKMRQSPSTGSPASTDQESSNIHHQSLSSTSDPIILDKQLLSFSSITDSYFLAAETLGPCVPHLTLLRLKEKSLVQKTRAELAWLEVLKRKCRECGAEGKVPALRKKQRGLLLKLHDQRAHLKQLQKKCESETPHSPAQMTHTTGPTPVLSGAASVSEPSSQHQSSLNGKVNTTESVSTSLEQYPDEHKADENLSSKEMDTSLSSKSSAHRGSKVTLAALDSSKMVLKEWEHYLEQRRRRVQDILKWEERLNAEEKAVHALECQAVSQLQSSRAKDMQDKLVKTPSQVATTTDENFTEPHWKPASSEIYSESKTSYPVTEACSPTLLDKSASASKEDSTSQSCEVQPSKCHLSKQGPSIRSPLLPRLKGWRDSSGSDDSCNVSYTAETTSEQSDMEGQILALSEELKMRQLEAARLKREQRRCRREFLRQKEHVLKKHIEMYDQLIEQAKADLDKEKCRQASSVKPQIKKPVVMEPHKRLSLDVSNSSSSAHLSSRVTLPHEELSLGSSDTSVMTSSVPSAIATESITDAPSTSRKTTQDSHLEHGIKENSVENSGETSLKSVVSCDIMLQQGKPNNPLCEDPLNEGTDDVIVSSYQSSSGSGKNGSSEKSSSASEPFHLVEDTTTVSAMSVESMCRNAGSLLTSIEYTPYGNDYDSSVSDCARENTEGSLEGTENDPVNIEGDRHMYAYSASDGKCVQCAESDARSDAHSKDDQWVPVNLISLDNNGAPERREHLEDTISPLLCEKVPSVAQVSGKVEGNHENGMHEEVAVYTDGADTHVDSAKGEKLDSNLVDSLVNSILMHLCNEMLVDVKRAFSSISSKTLIVHIADVITGASVDEEVAHKKLQQESLNSCCMHNPQLHAEDYFELPAECKSQHSSKGIIPDQVNAVILQSTVGSELVSSSSTNSTAGVTGDESLGSCIEDRISEVSDCSRTLCFRTCSEMAKKSQNETFYDCIDNLVQNMVTSAISVVLGIAEEKQRQATDITMDIGKQTLHEENAVQSEAFAVSNCNVSDVTKKLNSIFASLEQKRSHRELLRPQDMMVLSTVADEDILEPKDLPLFKQADTCKESNIPPSYKQIKKEDLAMGPVQPADTSLISIESDWFEDDIGLGSPFFSEQYAYPRQIPNKPPPPYSPPRIGSLLNIAKRPQESTMMIPHKEKDVEEICKMSAAVMYSALQNAENLDFLAYVHESTSKANFVGNEHDARSRMAFCEFLFSLTREVTQDTFSIADVPPLLWHRSFNIHSKLVLPSNKSQFMDIVSEKALTLRSVGSRESTIALLCPAARIRKHMRVDSPLDDEVDDAATLVLQREIRQEDPQWVDYSSAEAAVMELVADAVLVHVLNDTVAALKAISCDGVVGNSIVFPSCAPLSFK